MLTITITVMSVIRKNPETTWKMKEGFTEVIFKCGLERTIIMKHWKHSECLSEGPIIHYGTSTRWNTHNTAITTSVEGGPRWEEGKAAEPLEQKKETETPHC